MAKVSSNVVVPTADANKRSKKPPIHASHITTNSFMRPSPIYADELFPDRQIDISVNSFCRLNPLPRPVLSRAKVYNRAFFVPYRTIFRDFTQMLTSSPVPVSGAPLSVPNNVPFLYNRTLVTWLVRHSSLLSGTPSEFDFKLAGSTLSTQPDGAYKLNDVGAFGYKILRSLGYNPVFNVSKDFSVSALPLLAYIKVVLDWYYPSVYAYSDEFSYWEALFSSLSFDMGVPSDFLDHFTAFVRYLAYCGYEPDYFVSAWDNPVGPNSLQFEAAVNIPDVTAPDLGSTSTPRVSNRVSNVDDNGTPAVINSSDGGNASPMRQFTQYTLDALKSLSDWTKRHSLVGVRALDRYLAEFGINLQSELLKRSYYLGFSSFELNFYDVMSHADTDEASLGDFAGKSFANGSKKFSFKADEFGLFIVINSVVPLVSTYQGTARHVFHINPLDFYRGQFDRLGVQPIRKCELYVPKNGAAPVNGNGFELANQVFGFIPRYAEYQTHLDLVTGRFELATQNLDLRGYFQGRDLSGYDLLSVADLVHNLDFVLGTDYKVFNDIFYSDRTAEQICFAHDFNIQYTDSSLPIWNSYEFEAAFNAVKENIGGSTVN